MTGASIPEKSVPMSMMSLGGGASLGARAFGRVLLACVGLSMGVVCGVGMCLCVLLLGCPRVLDLILLFLVLPKY